METTLTIKKAEVLDEIAKTTAYIGAKQTDADGTAYDRISTTDEDAEMLARYWEECKATATGSLRSVVKEESESADGVFTLKLELSAAWNERLHDTMEKSLFSFFVMGMASKWQMLTDRQEVADYATLAAASLEDVKQKAFYKKRPTRPTYN